MSNATPEEPLTPPQEAEEEPKETETQADQAETSPESKDATSGEKETESAADYTKADPDAKSWEHALQLAREREKKKEAELNQRMQELEETKRRLDELELQGLDESEQWKVRAEKYQNELEELRQKQEVEDLKKEYRAYLADKESRYPKAAAFLKKQADRDIYPVQGQSPEEFDANFLAFAEDYEGTQSQSETKPARSNPAYTPPEEVDVSKLTSKELRDLLPKAER